MLRHSQTFRLSSISPTKRAQEVQAALSPHPKEKQVQQAQQQTQFKRLSTVRRISTNKILEQEKNASAAVKQEVARQQRISLMQKLSKIIICVNRQRTQSSRNRTG
ncbi:hypothetical protein FGO68_gene5165 [Halteria grandinella]|uniref:Uncharacterized protein n=1 Tax=Halteria grandinella TaxID=5974 RepID=A0A8J8NCH4_HALGN|nr:hypothetical protein FGO68_gene5165 [Halteria grandinella]